MDTYANGRKQGWLQQCINIHNFHVEHIKLNEDWTYRDTAKELKRSVGSVSQAIKVSRWFRTHPNKIATFQDLKSCLEWIREKDMERKSEVI